MKIEKLSKDERQKTRSLYEEVFAEDTKEFVDYYYKNKAPFNEIFAAVEGDQICGMAHLNPYVLSIDKREGQGAYLVAVATKKELRHRGIMTSLLKEVFKFLYEKEYPFLYLMPASELIYKPFDFRFFYSQKEKIYQVGDKRKSGSAQKKFTLREVGREDLYVLSHALNEILKKKYRLFASRTIAYLEDLDRELSAMNGKMIGIWHGAECVGSFQLIRENGTMMMEPLIKEEYQEDVSEAILEFLEKECPNEKIKVAAFDKTEGCLEEERKPWMMARIIHLERWICQLKSKEKKMVRIQVRDTWIPQNEGCYEILIEENGGKIRRIEAQEGMIPVSIADLPQFFKTEDPMADSFLNEWV